MPKKEIHDVAASILQRLKNYSVARREDRGLTLSNYAIERFLYRLSISRHASVFSRPFPMFTKAIFWGERVETSKSLGYNIARISTD